MNIIKRLFKRAPKKRWALLWGTNTLFGVCNHIRWCNTEKEAETFYTDIMRAISYAPSLVCPTIYDLYDPIQNRLFQTKLKYP